MVAGQLNAELRIGDLSYSFPYGVEVRDASLVANAIRDGASSGAAAPVELLHIPRLALRLARSPLRRGPLVIQSIQIDRPAIHLIETTNGLIGRRGLRKADDASNARQDGSPQPQWKLSEMFLLQRLVLNDGEVVYEDRSRPAARPLVWRRLNLDLSTAHQSGPQYAFHFAANNAPLATLDANGMADVDALLLQVSQCGLTVNAADPGAPDSPLPPEHQEMLAALGLRGQLALGTTATLPLKDLRHSTYSSTLELRDATARPPHWRQAIERLAATLHVSDGAGRPAVNIGSIEATSAGSTLRLASGSIVLDPGAWSWALKGLSGRIDGAPQIDKDQPSVQGSLQFAIDASGPLTLSDLARLNAELKLVPQDLRVRLAGFSQPVGATGPISAQVRGGKVAVDQILADCSNDVLFVRHANVDLTRWPRQLTAPDFQGSITFGVPRSHYPPSLENALAQLNPSGPWFYSGMMTLTPAVAQAGGAQKADYHLLFTTDRGGLNVSDYHIPVYGIQSQIVATPASIQIDRFNAGVFHGNVRLTGNIDLQTQTRYDLRASARGLDLNELARATAAQGRKPAPMSGRGNLALHAYGVLPGGSHSFLENLTADGEAEVTRGDFFRIPVMKSIADSAQVRQAITASDAAAVFHISRGAVHLSHAAVSAPILGIEGSGDVGFNGNLKLDVIATVLGDWSKKIDAGDKGLAGQILGTVQRGVNLATRQALYDIHVSGTTQNPNANAVLAPFLTRQATRLISLLNKQAQPGGLLGFVRQPPPSASK